MPAIHEDLSLKRIFHNYTINSVAIRFVPLYLHQGQKIGGVPAHGPSTNHGIRLIACLHRASPDVHCAIGGFVTEYSAIKGRNTNGSADVCA